MEIAWEYTDREGSWKNKMLPLVLFHHLYSYIIGKRRFADSGGSSAKYRLLVTITTTPGIRDAHIYT